MAYQSIDLPVAGTPITVADFGAKVKNNLDDHEARILTAESDIDTLQSTGIFLIAGTVLTGTAGTVTFTSIPATYSDLKLILNTRGDANQTNLNLLITFNGDSTATKYNYQNNGRSHTTNIGAASIGSVGYLSIGTIPCLTALANISGAIEITIPNYANTTFFKSSLSHSGAMWTENTSSIYDETFCGFWESTAAINRIDIFPASGNLITGSSLRLYGIK